MTVVIAMIFFGALIVLGVICLIVSFSSTGERKTKIKQSNNQETTAMVKYLGSNNVELMSLANGTMPAAPKKFDPHLVMEQLAQIQHSPNLISAYVNSLTAKFHTNRQIYFIKKIEEFYIALGSGMDAQLKLIELQDEFEILTDIEYRALKKQIALKELEKKSAKVDAETQRFRSIGNEQRDRVKPDDPYNKARKQTERQIAQKQGRLDALEALKQEEQGKIQNILRGRDVSEATPFETEELMKIRRYYGSLIDQL